MKIDKVTLIGILFIIVSLFLFIYYLSIQFNECTSNPLVYGAKQYQNDYDAQMVVGTMTLFFDIGTSPHIIYFNSSEKRKEGE